MSTQSAIDSRQNRLPDEIVCQLLTALEQQDHATISQLLSVDLEYTNVSLPTLKGGALVAKIFKLALRKGTGFQAKNHHIATNGNIVMTERTDILSIGSFHLHVWVCGTFEIHNGKVVIWRDYFDWLNVIKGVLRGFWKLKSHHSE